MKICFNEVTKRFGTTTIIKDFSYTFESSNSYWIAGPNGSGKSTLLQMISGLITPEIGKIQYFDSDHAELNVNEIYKYLSYVAPYSELIEEFTLNELVEFHFRFKEKIKNLSVHEIIEISQLQKFKNKPVQSFSSGMKQKVKLLIALTTQSKLVLLDEPTSNLDENAKQWYAQLIKEFKQDRLFIVCSNNLKEEHFFCNQKLELGL